MGSYIFTTVESATNKVTAAKVENAEVEAFTWPPSRTKQNPTTTFLHYMEESCTSSLQWDTHLQYLLHSFFLVWKKYNYFSNSSGHIVHSVLRGTKPMKGLGLSFQELPYSNVHAHKVLNSQLF